jgi:hypothetical protein
MGDFLNLRERVVVTGAASGMGRAVARLRRGGAAGDALFELAEREFGQVDFLLSDAASFVYGESFNVDGGVVMK